MEENAVKIAKRKESGAEEKSNANNSPRLERSPSVDSASLKCVNNYSFSKNEDIDSSSKDSSQPEKAKALSKETVSKEPPCEMKDFIKYHDIGLFKNNNDSGRAIVDDTSRVEIVQLGWKYFQNSEGPFMPTNNRAMIRNWFKKKMGDGRGKESSLEQEGGFTQWKAPERITVHANVKNHRESLAQWKEVTLYFIKNKGAIDARISSQIEAEELKWREVLTRILHCIKFLATQNLALRGHRKSLHILSDSNLGNFLNLLKLIAVFDPVLKEHLKNPESHPESTSYLSTNIQKRINSPPGIHFIVKESFLDFMEITVKNAKGVENKILEQLQKVNMNFQDCRPQYYDNNAVFAGHKNGVNERLKKKTDLHCL
ncbi:uncharacterized protein LOC117171103 [Belonocnema kinseyi]|uniref:uncharacterized protein LOC117171103 n=1 Tax=Belonocnema kinseyi TaxID=2817044 RepID=UPI00143D3DB7|nr:uncharacterized protein LOC117171103 [Belonocnema kinseyi]